MKTKLPYSIIKCESKPDRVPYYLLVVFYVLLGFGLLLLALDFIIDKQLQHLINK